MATTYKTLVETQPGDPSTSTWPVATDTFCATPAAALATSHFRIQYAISIIATFILNVGLNYAFLYKTSHIGIWSTAPNESSSTLPVTLDMILTSFCIVSLTVACNTPGIRKAIQKAEISPIHPTELSHGWYHLFPALHVEVSWLRAIVFGVQYVIMFTGLSIVFVYILAISGAFHGPSTFVDAYVSTTAWIWSKSCWAALCAACTFPIHYLAALNVEILPHHVWENYLVNIKLKTNNV